MKKTLFLFCAAALFHSFGIAAMAAPAEADQAFMKKVAQGGMTEVQLGAVAREKAQNPGVKQFGAMMTTDHSKATAELKALAQSKGVSLPADLDERHKSTVDKLSKLSGATFDKAYTNEIVAAHLLTIAQFETASKRAQDAEVKAFAEKTLPALRAHLEHARKLQKEVAK